MNAKKNPKYDLEKQRKINFNLGLLVVGSMTLAAFKYGSPAHKEPINSEVRTINKEDVYEFQEKQQPEKPVSFQNPKQPIIKDNERVVEVEKEMPKNPNITKEIPPYIDFNKGNVGLGEYGLNQTNEVDTFNMEFVEQFPSFPGGDQAMMSFIQGNFKFPRSNFHNEQGTIYVKFLVTHTGIVNDVKIERGISPELDKEALRIVRSMPNWEPAKHRGRPVNVRMIIPIRIKIH